MARHILLTRSNDIPTDFMQSEWRCGEWLHQPRSRPLSVLLPEALALLAGEIPADITISGFRGADAFSGSPDEFDFHPRAVVEVILPVGIAYDETLCCWLTYHTANQLPAKGPLLRVQTIGELLTRTFTQEKFAEWSNPNTAPRAEVWIRHNWKANDIAPELFPPETSTPIIPPEMEAEQRQRSDKRIKLARQKQKAAERIAGEARNASERAAYALTQKQKDVAEKADSARRAKIEARITDQMRNGTRSG